jgi:AraC family transcriptional regulator of adaptative response/methylated-DNA-[protein]-cysteine methyltransferase
MMPMTMPAAAEPAPTLLPGRAEMERAYLASDASYDGLFYLCVRTTGVFCRPSCPARKPRPEHVEFVARAAEAIAEGFRACRRCHPLEYGDAPAWLGPVLARVEAGPEARVRDEDLRAMDVEPARVRRYFTTRYGLTFQAFCRARRLARAFERVRSGGALDDAVFDSGYESHSGFREAFQKAFGAAPLQASGARCTWIEWIDTPLGTMVAGAGDNGLCLLEFADGRPVDAQLAGLRRRAGGALLPAPHPHLTTLARVLGEYFAGARRDFTLPVDAAGTPFEERVWNELRRIPYGETRSYADVAAAVDRPAGMRAVGLANGRNRVAIVIPCHRVVNKSGELGGYGGGLWRKRRLLQLEREHARR